MDSTAPVFLNFVFSRPGTSRDGRSSPLPFTEKIRDCVRALQRESGDRNESVSRDLLALHDAAGFHYGS